jgi:hypothetical protein
MKQLSPTDTNIILATAFRDVSPYVFIQYHMKLLPHLHSGNVIPTLKREEVESSKTLVHTYINSEAYLRNLLHSATALNEIPLILLNNLKPSTEFFKVNMM